jgi:hypothetical protein
MRRFTLDREVDITGVSGIGRVAEGVEFSNGKCALTWLTGVSSVAVYDSMSDLERIHGHGGSTKITYVDGEDVR